TVEEEGADGRALPILTGTTTMAVSPDEIAAWIEATHTYVDWQHNCEEARQIRREGSITIGYNRIGSPWPVSDRDVVLRSTRTNLAGGGIRMDFRNTTDSEVPVNRGVVRMPRLIGSYDLTPVEGGTLVIYTVDSDPGGSLPNWLVKQASKNLPYNTLKKLRERAEAGPPPNVK
ncbi:MAG: hypothetical protein IH936_16700, partial [Acidobacteria bacterium]|nr:hypothetical protein [Acidobacteriota bacterium]